MANNSQKKLNVIRVQIRLATETQQKNLVYLKDKKLKFPSFFFVKGGVMEIFFKSFFSVLHW